MDQFTTCPMDSSKRASTPKEPSDPQRNNSISTNWLTRTPMDQINVEADQTLLINFPLKKLI
jgi:hypothetical protein